MIWLIHHRIIDGCLSLYLDLISFMLSMGKTLILVNFIYLKCSKNVPQLLVRCGKTIKINSLSLIYFIYFAQYCFSKWEMWSCSNGTTKRILNTQMYAHQTRHGVLSPMFGRQKETGERERGEDEKRCCKRALTAFERRDIKNYCSQLYVNVNNVLSISSSSSSPIVLFLIIP